MIKSRFNLTFLDRWLPAVCILTPMLLTLVLFLLTLVLLQTGNAFSTEDPTAAQQAFRTIGDFTAVATFFCFTFLVPVGIIAGVIMFVLRRAKVGKDDAA
jgi:hypothetical protein